jgi:hypothetical protein
MGKLFLVITVFLYSYDGFSQTKREQRIIKRSRVRTQYLIHAIDSTSNYYLFKATNTKRDSVLLVVDKFSPQLKRYKKIELERNYTFKTYRFFDVPVLKPVFNHKVDDEEVWSFNEEIDLRFTDGMGDEKHKERPF